MRVSPPAPATTPSRFSPALSLAALGVVFGDIGTSPLYTLGACFTFSGASPTNAADVIGIASLLIWALVIVVCVKYLAFIMQADHDGEGGILALLALSSPKTGHSRFAVTGGLLLTVVIGAAMLLGDGSITPAISVISAVEGVKLLSPTAGPWIVPVSIVILVALFAVQSRGTERIGLIFGPVMVVWFASIAVAGICGIIRRPEILQAVNPGHALYFLTHHGEHGFFVLGGVVLAITGVEALYADLSHFGRKPIAFAWFSLVFPALVLCYLGESASTLADPSQLDQPLYALTPGIWRVPAILLATLATVIASQALISGAFTLMQQAIALGLSPRLKVSHTSANMQGQVYLPVVNWTLGIGCVALVLAFRSSERLASAFGLAVSCTMLATSLAWFHVATTTLGLPRLRTLAMAVIFVIVDSSFIIAGLPKFLDGGWIPFGVSLVLTILATTWRDGRKRVVHALENEQASATRLRDEQLQQSPDVRATMIVLSSDASRVPFYATHAWIRGRMLESRVILLTLIPERTPRIDEAQRVTVQKISPSFLTINARFGYMEPPRIRPILEACTVQGLEIGQGETAYFSADPRVGTAVGVRRMQPWRRRLFNAMLRASRSLPDDLELPSDQRVGVGVTVEL